MNRLISLIVLVCLAVSAGGQTTSFTYQGRITNSGAPMNGPQEITFRLFDSLEGGTQLGTATATPTVTNGVFSAALDFGGAVFNGGECFLEVTVGTIVLTPRQRIMSAPSAIRAKDAGSLDGVAASEFVQTTDPRLSNARTPTAGSPSYIQNQNTVDQSANFRVSGTGTVGGTFTVGTNSLSLDPGSKRISVGGLSNISLGVPGIQIGAPGNTAILMGQDSNNYLTLGWDSFAGGARFHTGSTGKPVLFQPSGGNVGIGTTTPQSKLHVNGATRVTGGSVYIANPNSLIITSPDGACWFVTVNNSGGLATISVPCP